MFYPCSETRSKCAESLRSTVPWNPCFPVLLKRPLQLLLLNPHPPRLGDAAVGMWTLSDRQGTASFGNLILKAVRHWVTQEVVRATGQNSGPRSVVGSAGTSHRKAAVPGSEQIWCPQGP